MDVKKETKVEVPATDGGGERMDGRRFTLWTNDGETVRVRVPLGFHVQGPATRIEDMQAALADLQDEYGKRG